jgi:hypothetical protein
MSRFRKKPVVIDATQFFVAQQPWPDGVVREMGAECDDPQCGDSTWDHLCNAGGPTGRAIVRTLEGPLRVSDGDWIITGVKGERYPCKPDIFEQTYEAVEE